MNINLASRNKKLKKQKKTEKTKSRKKKQETKTQNSPLPKFNFEIKKYDKTVENLNVSHLELQQILESCIFYG